MATNKQELFAKLANAGAPRDLAMALTQLITHMEARIEAFETLAASNRALADLTARVDALDKLAPHLPKLEKRG